MLQFAAAQYEMRFEHTVGSGIVSSHWLLAIFSTDFFFALQGLIIGVCDAFFQVRHENIN